MISVCYSRSAFRTMSGLSAAARDYVRTAVEALAEGRQESECLAGDLCRSTIEDNARLIFSRSEDALVILAIEVMRRAAPASGEARV